VPARERPPAAPYGMLPYLNNVADKPDYSRDFVQGQLLNQPIGGYCLTGAKVKLMTISLLGFKELAVRGFETMFWNLARKR
jgi:hypothetical protein